VESLRIEEGAAKVSTKIGDVVDTIPRSFQGNGEAIICDYRLLDSFSLGFDCKGRDSSKKLTIDPLVYSTFLGGIANDYAYSVDVDAMGQAYVVGRAASVDFPTTPGAFNTTHGGSSGQYDVFVTKLNSTGSGLIYSTFIGGSADDMGFSIVVDAQGCAYITGHSDSSDFPTTLNASDKTYATGEGFVTKLNSTGSGLVYSTYLGGQSDDASLSIDLDSSDNAYVTGVTSSFDFPTTLGAFKTVKSVGSYDAFVAKLDGEGSTLIYSTFLGGDGDEESNSITVDPLGYAYVAGRTASPNFPTTPGAFNTSYGDNRDAFVTKLNTAGTALVYSTFLGGTNYDAAWAIAVDTSGDAVVAGFTLSFDFPMTPGSWDTTYSGNYDSFVTRLNATGAALVYSTYLGGSGWDECRSIALDSSGNAFVTGRTNSMNFNVTSGAYNRSFSGLWDVFATEVDVTGHRLLYSTYIGGAGIDQGSGVALDASANLYLVGDTQSPDFPTTPQAFDPTHNFQSDAFALKLNTTPFPDLLVTSSGMHTIPVPPEMVGTPVDLHANVSNTGDLDATNFSVVAFDDADSDSTIDFGETVGTQSLDLLAKHSSTELVFPWIPVVNGVHRLCVWADPLPGSVNESDENNNLCCISVTALLPTDLAVLQSEIVLTPPSPIDNGSQVSISATIRNLGDFDAADFNVAVFDDRNGNDLIESGETLNVSHVPLLASHGSMLVSQPWLANEVGLHIICVWADSPPSAIPELNETNNLACKDTVVQSVSDVKPDYVPTQPLPMSTATIGLHSTVSLSVQVLNQGNATPTSRATVAFYNESGLPFGSFEVGPLSPMEISTRYSVTWTSPSVPLDYIIHANVDYNDDVSEWDESNNVYSWTIKVVGGPLTSLTIGTPNCTLTSTYVNSYTPLDFYVHDQSGTGVKYTKYRIDGVEWVNYTETGRFTLSAEGEHTIEWYSEDNATNVEGVSNEKVIVDNTPPATVIDIDDPQYQAASHYVSSYSRITLESADGGVMPVGLGKIQFRINGSQWFNYPQPFYLTGADGLRILEFMGQDSLGNVESPGNITLFLDNAAPTNSIQPDDSTVSLDTHFALEADDGSGSGVAVIEYSVDGGSFESYAAPFTLPKGHHIIVHRAKDNVNNSYQESHFVEVLPSENPPDERVIINYKPLIAFVFCIVLAAAAAFSAKSRPLSWFENRKRKTLISWAILGGFFVTIEAATGVLSLFIEALRVPPSFSWGTGIDCAVLAFGLLFYLLRLTRGGDREKQERQ